MPRVDDTKYLVMAGWDHTPHLSALAKERLLASTPVHEREARSKGIPILGEGRIFMIPETDIHFDMFQMPSYWPRISGIDFGWDHPTAGAWLAYDRDNDVIYVYDVYAKSTAVPLIHSAVFKAHGQYIPVAWPHDGLQHDKGSGEEIAEQYRKLGVNMLKDKVSFAPKVGEKEGDGGNSVEAGVLEMQDRFLTGRLKIAKHLEAFWFEYRLFHREKGLIVKKNDDVMSAVRYAMMMIRHAKIREQEQIITSVAWEATDSDMGY